ncbi:nuclear transport factor 2 family protein [Streptomyces sp. NBC_01340]|nr:MULTISPECIES: nuclear transport factor 2 family protein [unclassified Streptomyces]MCX4457450.1 nuclear transport factor 2 family protein [Streptomyces sp. NBC_01719]MCX4496807.1 nuclear transport factor 2 family protein [Streptomyces sp. NBC_01728]WSI41688.1 nuclear transport factor 2 family protein [Streptomyces sp. NBC_01340]
MTAQTETQPYSATGFAALYAEIQQFYARHMHLLDSGATDEWAADFTEDASFSVPTLPAPVSGRDALASAVRRTADANAASGEQHRHWPGVFDIRPQEDGSVVVHSYTTVYASPRGGESRVHRVCTCTDVLVRQGGRLLVRTREVARDDLR